MWVFIVAAVLLLFGVTAFTGAPYVPSRRAELRQAFTKLYRLSDRDTLVDIGAGDGVVLRIAKEYGAHGIGYEINPLLVLVAKALGSDVRLANLWGARFPDSTTVVYTFGDSRDIAKMYKKVEHEATRLGHELAFITFGFPVPGQYHSAKHRAFYLYHVKPLSE